MLTPSRRIARHGSGLCAANFLLAAYWGGVVSLNDASTAAAYASTLLLAWALVWGPYRVLRGERVPVSSYARRDLGIWSAIFGFIHLRLGLDEAMSDPYVREFVETVARPSAEELRRTLFQWGGLVRPPNSRPLPDPACAVE